MFKEGNLFTGNFSFSNLKLNKNEENKTKFDLQIDKFFIHAPLLGVLSSIAKIDHVQISNIKGNAVLLDKKDQTNIVNKKLKAKKSFLVSNIEIMNANLAIKKANSIDLNLQIDKFNIKPLRSSYAIFDLIFRNNMVATINSIPFNILTKEIDDGRETNWTIHNFPVEILSDYIDKTPFKMFKDGTVDIDIKDSWQLRDKSTIDIDCNLNFHNVTIKSSDGAGLLQKKLISKIGNYFDEKDKNISFKLSLNDNQWKGVASSDAADLWKIVYKAFIDKILVTQKNFTIDRFKKTE